MYIERVASWGRRDINVQISRAKQLLLVYINEDKGSSLNLTVFIHYTLFTLLPIGKEGIILSRENNTPYRVKSIRMEVPIKPNKVFQGTPLIQD